MRYNPCPEYIDFYLEGMTLEIEVKLFSILTNFLPHTARGNAFSVNVEVGTNIKSIIKQVKIPSEQIGIVVLNGEKINLEQLVCETLKEEDKISIFPPLAGG